MTSPSRNRSSANYANGRCRHHPTSLWRILENQHVQLFPDPTLPTDESGSRHRTAQRTAAKRTCRPPALSASMRMIPITWAPSTTSKNPKPARARQPGRGHPGRYGQRLDEAAEPPRSSEARDSATVRDVAVMQRMSDRRITSEITNTPRRTGIEGTPPRPQVEGLIRRILSN